MKNKKNFNEVSFSMKKKRKTSNLNIVLYFFKADQAEICKSNKN